MSNTGVLRQCVLTKDWREPLGPVDGDQTADSPRGVGQAQCASVDDRCLDRVRIESCPVQPVASIVCDQTGAGQIVGAAPESWPRHRPAAQGREINPENPGEDPDRETER